MARKKKPVGLRKKRAPGGRPWPKGVSGNPATKFVKGHSIKSPGRPRLPPGFREAMESLEPAAIDAIQDIVLDTDHKDRRQAAEYVLNQRHGKPMQRTEISGPSGTPLRVSYEDVRQKLDDITQKALATIPDATEPQPNED